MKKVILTLLIILSLVTACNANESSNDGKFKEDESKKEIIEEEGNNSSTNESNFGDFETVKSARDIGISKSGPVSIEVKEARIVSGSFNDQYYVKHFGMKDAEYIQIGMMISNDQENINFNSKHFRLTTDTGEKFNIPNESLSTKIEPKYLSEDGTFRVIFYFLEESKANEIDDVTLHVKALTDENGDVLGQDIEFKINFTGSNK